MQMQKGLKLKKSTGETLAVNEITEKDSNSVKNYGIWIRYDSRSGTHNMYREYRDTMLTRAVDKMYRDMAGRHRTRFRSIHIIRTDIIADEDLKRPATLQFANPEVKFPLPHRIIKSNEKGQRAKFLAKKPSTFYG
uniref:Large ribosomal subunit protein eL20 domain-containing protein n=2 Tax=Phaeomonas parva TaxID=124430 RepID=A0A7S1XKJ4_9STRA|mmetsp:Transcript_11638/g.35346  ORF Transcript_11638/g.35346 Transcript_11638/m.35346 type:complete len:136 (+) Transcript_11638:770-1177(+)